MINFLRNDYYRIKSKRYNVIISICMTMLSIFLAIYITSKVEVKGNVAVVTKNHEQNFQSKYIKFTFLDKKPQKYQLVLGQYDGLIIDKGNGSYAFDTIENNDFKKMLELIVKNPKGFVPPSKDSRGVGANIIGYLIMFILLQSVLYMFLLSEDIELKQLERIAASPIIFFKYLFSHFIFIFMLIFLPTFFILSIMKLLFGLNIGFSLPQYSVLLTLICSLGIAFSMFLNSLIKVGDTSNMMGSAIVTLSTILSGSFYSFENGNAVLKKALWMLPQKDFLSFVQGLEKGDAIYSILPQLIYVVALSIIFFVFSIIKIKKDYVLRRN